MRRILLRKPIIGRCSMWRAILVVVFSIAALTSRSAFAQTLFAPPPFEMVDQNGVPLNPGGYDIGTQYTNLLFPGPHISVGPPDQGGLEFDVTLQGANSWRHNWNGTVEIVPFSGSATVYLQSKVHTYDIGFGYPSTSWDGTTLDYDGSTTYTFTDTDGSVTTFDDTGVSSGVVGVANTLTKPSGERITFKWRNTSTTHRLLSVNNNLGYQLKFSYVCGTSGCSGYTDLASVTAINNAVEYCDPLANSCSLSGSWPTLTFTGSGMFGLHITDSLGNVTSSDLTNQLVSGNTINIHTRTITTPGGRTFTYIGCEYVVPSTGCDQTILDVWDNSTTTSGTQWHYHEDDDTASTLKTTTTITDPLGHDRIVLSDDWNNHPEYERIDPSGLNLTTSYNFQGFTDLLSKVTYPEGNYAQMTYDGRANLTEVRKVANNSDPDIVTTAVFPSTCSNQVTCNKATAVIDPNGNETDYTYDSTHGGILTATAPAVSGGRPVTQYGYSSLQYAWYYTNSSTISQETHGVYKQNSVGQGCISSTCIRTTTTSFQTGSSSVGSNILPTSVTSGDSSVNATVTSTYDATSNVATTSGPISGDTKAFFWDLNHNQLGVIQPDPDGGGSLLNPATKTTYNADGKITKVEQGTTAGQTSSDFAAFSSLTQQLTGYDSNTGDKLSDSGQVGGVTRSVTQYSYDGAHNLICTAVRENPSSFGSLPGACTITTAGSYGPDQITHNDYDNANRLTQVQQGYASGSAITERVNNWTDNSKINYVEDGRGYRTGYAYDGQDRLIKFSLPNPSSTHTISTTDYEGYGYDANGNQTSLRLRTGETIGKTYDALNRMTVKDIPGTTSGDVYYSYDFLGDQLYARFGSTSGDGVVFTYDALGRKLTETETATTRVVSSQYDAAGNRTRLTYPDSNYIHYTYDILNRMSQVFENSSSTAIVTYGYDNLSRMTSISRSNSANTAATYDGTDRDWTLALSGTSNSKNLTLGFAYTPGVQLGSRSLTNSVYGYVPSGSNTKTYNGLNQITSGSFTFDGRGNLTSDGSRSFSYDLENRLTYAVGTGTVGTPTNWGTANWNAFQWSGAPNFSLTYDPIGRLHELKGANTQQFLYDDARLIVEYDGSGTVLRRYVPGAGADQTLVWYEGTGLSTRNFLHTDEQGSLIATTDGSATAATYTYSATGEPGGGFASGGPAFRYTGQAQLAALGLYYYKARMYDSGINRFLQTDPVGYDAGLNLYAYVGNDPVNKTDSTGNGPEVLAGLCVGPQAAACLVGLSATTVAVLCYYECGPALRALNDEFQGLINKNESDEQGNDQTSDQTNGPAVPTTNVGEPPNNVQGNRTNSGPLAAQHGGSLDSEKDFNHLTGGKHSPAPPGSTWPEGTRIGNNGIAHRPAANGQGPRIDIPSNGDKAHETLHYPTSVHEDMCSPASRITINCN